MSVDVKAMRRLHRCHQQIRDLKEQIETGPKQVAARERNVARLTAEQEIAQEELTACKVAVDLKQSQLKSGEAKIVDLRTKLNACSTNKEYQALLEQIAADEMTNSVLEDEILEGLDKIEQLQGAAKEAAANTDKGRGELAKTQQAVAEKQAQLEAELARVQGELKEAESTIPADFREMYDRVVKSRGDEAMAAVEDNVCGGCYQQVTPNRLNELALGRVVLCTGCGCLLYLPEDRSIGGED